MARRSGLDSTQQVRLQITFCHFLNAQVRMRGDPPTARDIVFQHAVIRGTMAGLADEAKLKLCPTIVSDGESDRIARSLYRQPRTGSGISKIAEFPQLPVGRFGAFMAGCRAMANPSRAQREARRVKPATIVQLARRHEKWTRHLRRLLLKDGRIVLSQSICR